MSGIFVPGGHSELPWPEQIDHLSASSMGMLLRCPEQYRHVYILGERRRPSAASIWGRSDHAAVAYNYSQKVESGIDLPTVEVMEKFVERIDVEVEEGGDEIDWGDDNPAKMRDKMLRWGSDLVAVYQSQVAPLTQPEVVEEPFSWEDPILPTKLVGYADLIAQDVNPFAVTEETRLSNRRLIDRKTTPRKKSKPDPDWALQARLYQLAWPLPYEWQLSIKKAEPEVLVDPEGLAQNPWPQGQTLMLVRGIMETLAGYYRAHGPDQPWPGYGLAHTWACNYCGFRPGCYWWKES